MKKLERSLSVSEVIAISLSAMLGSGIFVLPGLAYAKTGSSVWLAYVFAGICILPAAFSKSELSTAMPTSGGTYVYLEKVFGPLIGTIAGIGLWLSLILKSSFALVGFGAYLLVVSDFPIQPTAIALLSLIIGINVLGAKKVGRTQLVVTLVCIGSLLGLVCVGLKGSFTVENTLIFEGGGAGFLSATAFVFVSFAGVTKIAAIAEEVKNPSRNLPIAMLSSLGIVTVLYGLVVYVLVTNIPEAMLVGDLRPIYTLARELSGPTVGYIAGAVAILTMTSMANAGLLATSRFPFAMSRDNLIPPFLGHIHPRLLTPLNSIVFSGLTMAAIIVFLEPEKIAKLASAFKIILFMSVNLSVIILRETAVQWYQPKYLSPFYPYVQIFGLVSGLVLLFALGSASLVATGLIIGLGLVVYFFYGRVHASQRGVLTLYGNRAFFSLVSKKFRAERQRQLQSRLERKSDILEAELSTGQPEVAVASEASVVVPLFGNERSPETLVEMAAALAGSRPIQVLHITEIPDQTELGAMLESDPTVRSLARRFQALAEEKHLHLEFEAMVSHDVVRTVRQISTRPDCVWLVMCWEGRSGDGLLVRNPIGWLIPRLSCNLALFRDAGIRYTRKILVHPEEGPHQKLVVNTASHLAKIGNASLTFVSVVPPNADETVLAQANTYVEEMCSLAGVPADANTLVVRGLNRTSEILELSAGYDLLVTGAPPEEHGLKVVLGTGRDRLTEKAGCSVLRLTTPRSR